jgi:hypothetical protein
MSNRYKGAVISATPPTTTGGESGTASGAWTLEQQMQAQAAGLWPIQPPPVYVEDVFSTWLYTGTGASLTIPNGINLSGKGGLTWTKSRSSTAFHKWYDSARGIANAIESNTTDANQNEPTGITSFNSNGYTYGTDGNTNSNGVSYVSWTFREQPKFFDIVTYTGNGVDGRNIAHNLGSVPGCVIVKPTSAAGGWVTYHRSLGATKYLELQSTNAAATYPIFYDTAPTSSVFTVGVDINTNGVTYVAYLFAHDAGGFGLTETDNVISCGSFTPSGGEATVNLGYEPQWILWKNADGAYGWFLLDNMRGIATGGDDQRLVANSSNAEGAAEVCSLTSTGFKAIGQVSGNNYVYIAIRRGPMAVPTLGTSVFAPVTYTGDNSNTRVITTGFPPDMVWTGAPADGGRRVGDRLRGLFTNPGPVNYTYSTLEESLNSYSLPQMNGWQTGNGTIRYENSTAINYVLHAFKRAPSFFDVVCYTGTGTYGATNHNLGVTPELVIYKSRSNAANWGVIKPVSSIAYYDGLLNSNSAFTYYSNDPSVAGLYTSTQFAKYQDTSSYTYVAYLFATCAGVSKVGTYTGTGAAQTINCGFTAGSRFVLIKRTDSTGDWYLWDSARGIIPSNDPYLLLNSFAAEVTGTDYVDTTNVGFDITSTAPAGINASGGTYIFLAIA